MGSGYTRATHDIEGQNDERLEGLLGKVKILKDVSRNQVTVEFVFAYGKVQITTGIGNEVRDSNIQLGNMASIHLRSLFFFFMLYAPNHKN